MRPLRYFCGHTSVDGSAFGYHASPIALLKGRLVAYGVVLVLGVLGQVAPLLVLVLCVPEADDFGLGLLYAAGIDRAHFIRLLSRLEAASGLPGFLSTHPRASERGQQAK